MRRLKRFRAALVAAFLSICALLGDNSVRAAEPGAKPNILFVFADDMRADSIGALGNPTIKTPHLDALVKRGLAFRNAYCFGGNSGAVCTPSRNMLLSGRCFYRFGGKSVAQAEQPNVPTSLKQAGYHTYHHGKRGNTAPAIQALFDVDKYVTNDQQDRSSGNSGKSVIDDALAFLRDPERQKAGKPFLMYLAPGVPHDPRVATKEDLAQYDRDKIPLPANYLPVHPFDNGEMTIRDEKLSPWPRTEAEIRKTLHEYYAVVTGFDRHLGRLFQTLDELKLTESTLVVFSADQGIAVGSHGLLGKQNLYDHSMKVPFVFAGPGVRQGTSDAMVYLFDIFPTLCELAGAPVPAGLDGRSFRAVLQDASASTRKEMLLAYQGVQRAYRDERWKLIRYPQVNVTQLFDLRDDPHETRNLSAAPDQVGRVAELTAKMKELQTAYGDTLPLTIDNPKPAAWSPPKPGSEPPAKAKKKKNAA